MPAAAIDLKIKEGTSWSDNYGHHSLQNDCCSSDPKQITALLLKIGVQEKGENITGWFPMAKYTFYESAWSEEPSQGSYSSLGQVDQGNAEHISANWLRSCVEVVNTSGSLPTPETDNSWDSCKIWTKSFRCRFLWSNLLAISSSGASQASHPHQVECGCVDKSTLQTKIERQCAEWSGRQGLELELGKSWPPPAHRGSPLHWVTRQYLPVQ